MRAIGLALVEYPRLNRFVVGSRLYDRKGIWLAFSAKQRMEKDAPIFTAKVAFDPAESLPGMVDRLLARLREGRSGKETATDREITGFLRLPAPVLRVALKAQRWLDGWNLLPSGLVQNDPLYASAFVANLGSVGLDAAFHHNYEYGTIPIFVTVGRIHQTPVVTAGAIDLGEKPSVVSAIVKYHCTERGRAVINDAMDVHGGKGICMGPSNYLASAYMQTPIAITVEGANILTRTMIIFGQGAIRGHPYVLKEIEATREQDAGKALRDFDTAFFGHIAFTLSNVARVLWMGFTGARLTAVPGAPELRHYYQQLTRLCSAFALTADMAMFLCGGTLKRRERLSARLGDVLSQLYLASTVLKRYEDDGRPQEDLPLVRWGLLDCLYRIEESFYSIFENLPWAGVSWILRGLIFPVVTAYGREFAPPRDPLGHEVVNLMMTPGPTRQRLTRGVFISEREDDPVRLLESALVVAIAAEPVEAKLRRAQSSGKIARRYADQIAAEGLQHGVIDQAEHDLIRRAAELRRKVIMVDDFPRDFGKSELYQTTQAVTFEALLRKRE